MAESREEDFVWITPATIVQNCKDARKRAGLTQRDFAERIGVKPKQVSRWENAKSRPSTANYKKILEILEL